MHYTLKWQNCKDTIGNKTLFLHISYNNSNEEYLVVFKSNINNVYHGFVKIVGTKFKNSDNIIIAKTIIGSKSKMLKIENDKSPTDIC